jgi:hypothetical protein
MFCQPDNRDNKLHFLKNLLLFDANVEFLPRQEAGDPSFWGAYSKGLEVSLLEPGS